MGWNFVFELLLNDNIHPFLFYDLKFLVSIYDECVDLWKISNFTFLRKYEKEITFQSWFLAQNDKMSNKFITWLHM